MGQNCDSSLNIMLKSNILIQFNYLKVVLASFCYQLKEYLLFIICGEKVKEKYKKYWKSQRISEEEKSGNRALFRFLIGTTVAAVGAACSKTINRVSFAETGRYHKFTISDFVYANCFR